MLRFILAAAVAAATASLKADTVVNAWYFPDANLRPASLGYLATTSGTILASAYVMSDGSLAQVLTMAASSGRYVGLVLNASGGTNAIAVGLALSASGVHVTTANFADTQANNFLTAGGTQSIYGTYRWSPTAVQVGLYLQVTSGTTQPAAQATTYAALVSGGTPHMATLDSQPPPLAEPAVINADQSTTVERRGDCKQPMVLRWRSATALACRTVPLFARRSKLARVKQAPQYCPRCASGQCTQPQPDAATWYVAGPPPPAVGYQNYYSSAGPPPPCGRVYEGSGYQQIFVQPWSAMQPVLVEPTFSSRFHLEIDADAFRPWGGRYSPASLGTLRRRARRF